MFCLLQVLWKEIQALQVEQELDREFGHHGGAGGGGGGHQNHQGHHGGQGGQGYPDRRMEREKRRVTERKFGRLIGGAESRIYDDSDSSRGGCTVGAMPRPRVMISLMRVMRAIQVMMRVIGPLTTRRLQ